MTAAATTSPASCGRSFRHRALLRLRDGDQGRQREHGLLMPHSTAVEPIAGGEGGRRYGAQGLDWSPTG